MVTALGGRMRCPCPHVVMAEAMSQVREPSCAASTASARRCSANPLAAATKPLPDRQHPDGSAKYPGARIQPSHTGAG